MPQSFVQIPPNWNEMEDRTKRNKRGLNFVFSNFNDLNISYGWYMSNATKFCSDLSKLQ